MILRVNTRSSKLICSLKTRFLTFLERSSVSVIFRTHVSKIQQHSNLFKLYSYEEVNS